MICPVYTDPADRCRSDNMSAVETLEQMTGIQAPTVERTTVALPITERDKASERVRCREVKADEAYRVVAKVLFG